MYGYDHQSDLSAHPEKDQAALDSSLPGAFQAFYLACPSLTSYARLLLQGGSGQALDWSRLKPPASQGGWLLAGGLKPENVTEAVRIARPTVVDVSSGVCGPDGEGAVSASQGFLF